MAGQFQHIKMFVEDAGIDLRSGEVSRSYPFATNSQNTEPSAQGAISTRKGTQIKTAGYGKFGITRFDTTSMLGVSKSEIIGFGADSITNSAVPYRLVKGTFTVTNDHVSAAATITCFYDPDESEFVFRAAVNGTTEVDQGLGIGTEGSPYMLSSLETVVDAAASFTMSTPTNASTTPAAFIELFDAETVASGASLTVSYYYWEQIFANRGTSNDYANLSNTAKELGDAAYQNVSTVVLNNVLYISAGTNTNRTLPGGASNTVATLCKYDGQSFYRAGMNKGRASPTITDVVAGTYTDAKGAKARTAKSFNDNQYFITMKGIDKAGNIVEGAEDTTPSAAVLLGSASYVVRVTMSPTAMASAGYNVGVAVATSTQTGLTINVDNGSGGNHNLQAGDIGYFWDNGQGRYIQREITARATGTITFSDKPIDIDETSPNYDDGSTPSLLNDAIISANLRYCLWRTKNGTDTPYYLVDEIPYNQVHTYYYDDKEDDDLGAEWIPPAYQPGTPPQGRYLAAFNNQLIISGNDLKPNTVFFSDEGPEAFPAGTHEFDVLGVVKGVKQTGSVLAVATGTTLDVVEGDLLNINFRVTRVSSSIGCTSHHSMQEIEEGILYFQSAKGPYQLVSGRALTPIGAAPGTKGIPVSRLEPFFVQKYAASAVQPCFKRSVSGLIRDLNLYLLFVPFEDPAKPGFATAASVLWVYDYSRDSWRKWTGINAAGGIAELENVLYFSSRAHDGASGVDFDNALTRLSQQQVLKGRLNYADHNNYVDAKHQYHWESFGEPTIFKKPLRISVHSLEDRVSSEMPISVKTYLDFDDTLLSTSDSMTFTTEKTQTLKLTSDKAKAVMLSLESQEFYKPLLISGLEVEIVAPYQAKQKE